METQKIPTLIHSYVLPIVLLLGAYAVLVTLFGNITAVGPQLLHIIILASVYLLLAAGLNLAIGFSGLLNLGHIAFFGVGAYTSALLTTEAGFSFIPAFIIAGCAAGAFGLLLVIATRRVREEYFALATLGFSFVMYSLFLNWQSLTHGPLGISAIPKPELFGVAISGNLGYALLAIIIAVAGFAFVVLLTNSRYGKLLEAMRDDDIGLSALGKHVTRLKAEAMIISAALAGGAGSLFAHYLSYINPSSFYLQELILVLIMVFVGGLASLRGTLVAVFIVLLIPEMIRLFDLPSAIAGPLRQMIYVLLLLAILLWRPRGLWGRVDLE